ncbi:MAG: DUF4242 domain-containing protein [Bacteroidales bacterium]|nr:DUF4242 domain-containing protein [Bacteroidales bacterium]
MPIYMDRHDVSETVTAKNVAQLHQQDLKIQHQYNCKGITYWFDEERKTAFCLIEAPNEKHIQEMHKHAHGEVPHVVIEVDTNIVESFLGRIEDPVKAKNTDLNIINDPAFRIIMVFRIAKWDQEANRSNDSNSINEFHSICDRIFSNFHGSVVKHDMQGTMVSFQSVTNAVNCALELQLEFHNKYQGNDQQAPQLKLGLNAGLPVTGNKALFEDTIKFAERLCAVSKEKILLSSEVIDLYRSENLNKSMDESKVLALTSSDEDFVNQLLDFIEKEWKNSDLKVDSFSKPLGLSKSQLYRKMISLTAQSPNTFLKEYRLNRALELIKKKSHTISEIAYDTGFSSLSYFSKCFLKQYGALPSEYLISIE